MRWWVLALALINLTVFLGAQMRTAPDPAFSPRAPVDTTAMRLLSEVDRPPARVAAGEVGGRCMRLGPFLDLNAVAAARGGLLERGFSPRERVTPAREVRAWRVFVGPFDADEEVERMRDRLLASGVEDFYLMRGESGVGALSLGLFSVQGAAEDLAAGVGAGGIDASVRSEDRPVGPVYWLEFADTAGGVAGSLPSDFWGEPRARLRQVPCAG